jgi:hypothetical protein
MDGPGGFDERQSRRDEKRGALDALLDLRARTRLEKRAEHRGGIEIERYGHELLRRPITSKLIEQLARRTLRQSEPARLPGPIVLRRPGPLNLARLSQTLEDLLDVIAWWKTPGNGTDLSDHLVAVGYKEGLPCFDCA